MEEEEEEEEEERGYFRFKRPVGTHTAPIPLFATASRKFPQYGLERQTYINVNVRCARSRSMGTVPSSDALLRATSMSSCSLTTPPRHRTSPPPSRLRSLSLPHHLSPSRTFPSRTVKDALTRSRSALA
jgi:hypothetical protein